MAKNSKHKIHVEKFTYESSGKRGGIAALVITAVLSYFALPAMKATYCASTHQCNYDNGDREVSPPIYVPVDPNNFP